MTGWFFHLIYQIVLLIYIDVVYLNMKKDAQNKYIVKTNVHLLIALAACLIYPMYTDGRQIIFQKQHYFREAANYINLLQIILGYVSIVQQYYQDPVELIPKTVMIITVITSLMKQFFYMRVVAKFSYIVTMMVNVIIDLSTFLVFFLILVFMFSLVFDVIAKNDAPEYHNLPPFAGNLLTTMRLALNDFDFGILANPEKPLNTKQHILFWTVWCLMVALSSLIFLNFIIAEVSNSYKKVRVRINELVLRERATLIDEIEKLKGESYINSHKA
jgi:hypothetical protein